MRDRYGLRRDPGGWTVFDIWTAQPVVIGRAPQIALELGDASEVAAILNDHARRGDRLVRQ